VTTTVAVVDPIREDEGATTVATNVTDLIHVGLPQDALLQGGERTRELPQRAAVLHDALHLVAHRPADATLLPLAAIHLSMAGAEIRVTEGVGVKSIAMCRYIARL